MAEHITRSESNQQKAAITTVNAPTEEMHNQETQAPPDNEHISAAQIIWTPRFIVLFAFVLALGLSMASLLTQGWLNHYYRAELVLLAYTTLVSCGWIVMIARAHSVWARVAGVAGCLWSAFSYINIVLSWLTINASSPIVAHLNAATNCALLGAYICLSVAHTPLSRWDSWFFRLAPLIGAILVIAVVLLTPPEARSLSHLESTIAAVALYYCLAVWWLRPSCWKRQAGPAFLFGMAPVILLILAIPNIANGGTNFFFSQLVFLCFILGAIRVLQGERRRKTSTMFV